MEEDVKEVETPLSARGGKFCCRFISALHKQFAVSFSLTPRIGCVYCVCCCSVIRSKRASSKARTDASSDTADDYAFSATGASEKPFNKKSQKELPSRSTPVGKAEKPASKPSTLRLPSKPTVTAPLVEDNEPFAAVPVATERYGKKAAAEAAKKFAEPELTDDFDFDGGMQEQPEQSNTREEEDEGKHSQLCCFCKSCAVVFKLL